MAKGLSLYNPTKWEDPDQFSSSEYRAIYEHAMSVWNSNPGECTKARCRYVLASLVEMRSYLDVMLKDPEGILKP